MVAALGGTTSIVTATAAGMVVSAATVLAVLIYAAAVWAWRTALARAATPQPASL
jgi:protein-S-isoprenylcysteine O-methyltransferase Ste14